MQLIPLFLSQRIRDQADKLIVLLRYSLSDAPKRYFFDFIILNNLGATTKGLSLAGSPDSIKPHE